MIEQCNLANAFWNSILDATKTDNGMGNC